MKFSLSSSFDSPYKGVADLTLPVLMEYCNRHGYELSVKQNMTPKRGVIWQRIEDMMNVPTGANWLAHADSDVLITNLTIPLDSIVSQSEGYGSNPYPLIIVGSDQNGINDGILFIRNVTAARLMVADIMQSSAECFQAALQEAIRSDDEVKFATTIAPQRLFNSYFEGEYPDQDPNGVWRTGDFCFHLPGRSNPRRVEILQQFIPLIQR